MQDEVHRHASYSGRVFNYANNPVTLIGIALATVSAIFIVVFFIAESGGALHNPYLPVFSFLVLPIIFLFGLIIIPVGMLRKRRKLIAAGTSAKERAAYPVLDFNEHHLRRIGTVVLGLTAVNAIILASVSYFAVEHMDTVEFCGTTCHTVMRPEFTAYQHSPHSRVSCVQCHIGPGASWFVRSKLDGLRQVWRTIWDTYQRPVPSPVHTLRPARETCESCHWPAKHHGDKIRIFARFGQDEANSPSYSALLLKTGGGRLDLGRHGGIHWWHIYSDNRIRYVAKDERREEILWVELTTPDGNVRTYTREGEELPNQAELQRRARVMDCIDCHNRPTHLFEEPGKALDAVLESDPELLRLPYYKRQALQAIKRSYERHDEGVSTVKAAIESYYREKHPHVVKTDSRLVSRAAEAAASVYDRSFFPEMSTDWETHPNHIGHEEFPGCWRCHDDELSTSNGNHVIEQDCELCHGFLLEDVPSRPDFAELLSGSH